MVEALQCSGPRDDDRASRVPSKYELKRWVFPTMFEPLEACLASDSASEPLGNWVVVCVPDLESMLAICS